METQAFTFAASRFVPVAIGFFGLGAGYFIWGGQALFGFPKTSPEEFRRRYIDAIRAKVNLDPQQIERVNQIMDDARAQFDQVRAKSRTEMQAIEAQRNEQMNAILRDDQKPAYAAFRAERDRLRQQAREKPPKK